MTMKGVDNFDLFSENQIIKKHRDARRKSGLCSMRMDNIRLKLADKLEIFDVLLEYPWGCECPAASRKSDKAYGYCPETGTPYPLPCRKSYR